MFGLNPVATGMLIGTVLAPGMGTVVGGAIGAMYDDAQGQKRDAEKAQRRQVRAQVSNENALVKNQYEKLKAARGIGETTAAEGVVPTQSGAVLKTLTNDETVNLLG